MTTRKLSRNAIGARERDFVSTGIPRGIRRTGDGDGIDRSIVEVMTTAGLLQMQGYTRAPRHEAIVATNDALTECGVILEDMHEYSNRMTTYRFEIDRDEVALLVQRLGEAGVTLEGEDPVKSAAALRTDDDGFVRTTLQLTFPDEDGDRKVPNPDMG